MMELVDLTAEQQTMLAAVDGLVQERIAPRAARYDAGTDLPFEDLADLHRAGLLLASMDERHGGLGCGLACRDPLLFFLVIERLAKGNPSTAHCWQVHNNTLQMIDAQATDEQRERWIAPTRERGALLVGVGAEPAGLGGTVARRVPGGYLVTGRKHYATNATGADWLQLSCHVADTGESIQTMVSRSARGLRVDASFWEPVGMRACTSPVVDLDEVFVPEEDVLGQPGAFVAGNWLAKINMTFTANYVGSMDEMLEWIAGYLRERGQAGDPVNQAALGELRSRLDGARLLCYRAVQLLRTDEAVALRLGDEAKWLAIDALHRCLYLGAQIAGSTALFRRHPFERFVRDMTLHSLHTRHHVVAGSVGRAVLEPVSGHGRGVPRPTGRARREPGSPGRLPAGSSRGGTEP